MFRSLFLSLLTSLLVLSSGDFDAGRSSLASQQEEIIFSRADPLLSRGMIAGAKTLYSGFRDDGNNNLRALIGLGRVALAERDWEGALAMARQAMKLDTGNMAPHYIAAVAYREIGRDLLFNRISSRKEFRWVLDRDSSFEDALYQFALLERDDGDRDHALELARIQIAQKPDLLGPQIGLFRLYGYFMAVQGLDEFIRWLGNQPGSIPQYFIAERLRRDGNLAAAETLLTALLYHSGDLPAQAVRLSLARLRFQQGERLAAEAEYWRGVQDLRTDLGAAILFEDLKYVVSDAELATYEGLDSLGARREFFRSFWNFRNPSLALGGNLRLQEHIGRYIQAQEKYEYHGSRTQFNNPDRLRELYFPGAFALNEEFNDMGMVFLRQGAPDDVLHREYAPYDDDVEHDFRIEAYYAVPRKVLPPPKHELDRIRDVRQHNQDDQHGISGQHDSFESWLYNGTAESPRMIFHFTKHNTAGNNWRLMPLPTYDPMIAELQLWDSKYQRLYDGTEGDRLLLQTQIKIESKALVAFALSTEKQTWEKKTETFQFPHSIDVFRAPDGRSLLDVSYAIPLASLSHNLPDSVKSIPIEIGFSLVDAQSRHSATRRDTMEVGLSRTRTGTIIDLIRYSVPPDSYSVSMHIRPLLAGMIGTWRQTVRVRDFSPPDFMMSSIQFLRPSTEKGALAIEGVKVVQSPFSKQVRTEPFYVYYQIYHLVPDASGTTSYRTECILLPAGENTMGKGAVVYTKEKTGKEEMAAEFCQIDLQTFDPGRYRIIVNVTDRKRVQTLTAVREFDIVKP